MITVHIDLTDDLTREASARAEATGVTLWEFIAQAVVVHVATRNGFTYLRERGRRGDRETFLSLLDKAPDVDAADPADRIE